MHARKLHHLGNHTLSFINNALGNSYFGKLYVNPRLRKGVGTTPEPPELFFLPLKYFCQKMAIDNCGVILCGHFSAGGGVILLPYLQLGIGWVAKFRRRRSNCHLSIFVFTLIFNNIGAMNFKLPEYAISTALGL